MALGQVSSRWQHVSNAALQRWDRLSEEEVTGVRGNAERLVSLLQGHYGLPREQALKELTDWRKSLAASRIGDVR